MNAVQIYALVALFTAPLAAHAAPGQAAAADTAPTPAQARSVEAAAPDVDARRVGVHRALGSDLLGRGPLMRVLARKADLGDRLDAAMAGGAPLSATAGVGVDLRGVAVGLGRIRGMGDADVLDALGQARDDARLADCTLRRAGDPMPGAACRLGLPTLAAASR